MNEEAFAKLMDDYEEQVMRFVERMIPLEQEAQEVVQDTFIGAYKSMRKYNPEKSSLATWLCRIAYHKIVDHLKQRSPTPYYIFENESALAGISDEMVNTMMDDETPDRILHLRQAIRKIPPEDQLLLQLYYTEDRPLGEISYILGPPASYLATRLQRIRKKLYILIKDMERYEQT